jgi:hypothetical protein
MKGEGRRWGGGKQEGVQDEDEQEEEETAVRGQARGVGEVVKVR